MLQKNGWSSGSHLTKPPPSQNGCSSKTFLQIIIAAKWLVWHSSTSPKQQRRPLPSLLSLSFFYAIGTGKEKTRVLNSHLAESVEQTRSKVLLLLMLWLDDDSCCCWQLLLAGRRRSSWSVSPWDTSSSCSWVSSWRACSSSLCTCKSWLTYMCTDRKHKKTYFKWKFVGGVERK